MNHIINKQLIALRMTRQKDAFRAQHLLAGHYWKELVPLLETCLDALAGEDELLQLDQLEIDLGAITLDELEKNSWNKDFLLKIERLFREQLSAVIARQRLTPEKKILGAARQWLFYMGQGYLPWNTIATGQAWLQEVLQALAVDIPAVAQLRQLLNSHRYARQRIVLQHDAVFLQHLVSVLTAQPQAQLHQGLQELVQLEKMIQETEAVSPQAAVALLQLYWQQVLQYVSGQPQQQSTNRLLHHLLEQRMLQQPATTLPAAVWQYRWVCIEVPLQQLAATYKQLKQGIENTATAAQSPAETQQTEKAGETDKKDTGAAREKNRQDTVTDAGADTGRKTAATLQETGEAVPHTTTPVSVTEKNGTEPVVPTTETITPFHLAEDEYVFAHHAGLVLVHPFLNNLMKRLELVTEKKFIHTAAQQKAVWLLHYLATGETTAEEHLLVIPKLLCNHALSLPLPPVELHPADLAEADDMLAAVIQQWDKIKNTSVAALREGFLQRKGKLYRKNDSLYLRVESSAIDVLLDYLPWGWNIGSVLLPWMKDILKVEWRT
jgi:hypothetical protein